MTSPAGRTFDAVLFDLDGTLVDSTPSVLRCWSRWAAELGLDRARLAGGHGVPARQVAAAALGIGPDDPALAPAVARIDALELADLDEHDDVVALPGAVAALAAVPAARLAVVTSCRRELAAARLHAAGLAAPATVVTADDVVTGKPDPAPYLLGARRLGVAPARCLVVEDAPSGLVSGRAAGAATLAVSTTTPPDELDADLVVASLAQVAFVAAADGVRLVVDGHAGAPAAGDGVDAARAAGQDPRRGAAGPGRSAANR